MIPLRAGRSHEASLHLTGVDIDIDVGSGEGNMSYAPAFLEKVRGTIFI